MGINILDLGIDELLLSIERSLRSTTINQIRERFVPPDHQSLEQVMNNVNHIVFGRRGSGKSSLLLKAKDELDTKGNITIYLDANIYFQNDFPDILILMLKSIIEQSTKSINSYGMFYKIRKKRKLLKIGTGLLDELDQILKSYDNANVSVSNEKESQKDNSTELGVTIGLENQGLTQGKSDLKTKNLMSQHTTHSTKQDFTRNKIYELNKKIDDFGNYFSKLVEFVEKDIFLFIDDLYFIKPEVQTKLLTFFQQISKGRRVWLKIGTIRFRSRWYSRESGDFYGLKIGDDAIEINLDKTLESFDQTKYFQEEVLNQFNDFLSSCKPVELLNISAQERLVLASGGVVRDYLRIYVKSLRLARSRLTRDINTRLGKLISVVDVNDAASEFGDNKLEELPISDPQDENEIRTLFDDIKAFCFKNKHNYFLVDRNDTELALKVGELMDLRLIHLVKSSISVSDKSGINYSGYILDASQYVGKRKRRSFSEINLSSEKRYDFRRKSSIFRIK